MCNGIAQPVNRPCNSGAQRGPRSAVPHRDAWSNNLNMKALGLKHYTQNGLWDLVPSIYIYIYTHVCMHIYIYT